MKRSQGHGKKVQSEVTSLLHPTPLPYLRMSLCSPLLLCWAIATTVDHRDLATQFFRVLTEEQQNFHVLFLLQARVGQLPKRALRQHSFCEPLQINVISFQLCAFGQCIFAISVTHHVIDDDHIAVSHRANCNEHVLRSTYSYTNTNTTSCDKQDFSSKRYRRVNTSSGFSIVELAAKVAKQMLISSAVKTTLHI